LANFLVTGGTGQIGQYVCSELLRNGANSVVILDAKPNFDAVSRMAPRPEIISGDVSDMEKLLQIVKAKEISHIIHLAATLVLESKQFPTKAIQVNCIGTNNVFEAARLAKIERATFVSSVAVYGSKDNYPRGIVNEDDFPMCPPDPYSITKFASESMGQYYRDAYGLNLLCARLAGAWGPGRYSGYTGQFNDFIRRASIGEEAVLPEDFAYTNAKLRWLYVKDMASALVHVSLVDSRKIQRGLYNIGTMKPFTSFELVEKIKKLAPEAKIKFSERKQPTKISSEVAGPSGLDVDCSRLYSELSYKEGMGLEASVEDVMRYEREKVGV
jgi:UDP-glucose 4-epimerase